MEMPTSPLRQSIRQVRKVDLDFGISQVFGNCLGICLQRGFVISREYQSKRTRGFNALVGEDIIFFADKRGDVCFGDSF